MNLVISGRHVDLTPALKALVESQFGKLWKRFRRVVAIRLTLAVEKTSAKEDRQCATACIMVKNRPIALSEVIRTLARKIHSVLVDVHRQKRDRRLPGGRTQVRVSGRSGSSYAHA